MLSMSAPDAVATNEAGTTARGGKRVAIVVPLSDRPTLSGDERTSLRHLQQHLGQYDRFFLAPPGLHIEEHPGFRVRRLNAKYFGSGKAHDRLYLSVEFYEGFSQYEFLLMYHLDALVFSDQLLQWCERGYDFVGPPWIPGDTIRWTDEEAVGNGGFALLKVGGFLRMLRSRRRFRDPAAALRGIKASGSGREFALNVVRWVRAWLPVDNDARAHVRSWLKSGMGSDLFISRFASYYNPEFRRPSVDEALEFAFEVEPRECFRRKGNQLPFGCHAWDRYDREFWEPFLLRDG